MPTSRERLDAEESMIGWMLFGMLASLPENVEDATEEVEAVLGHWSRSVVVEVSNVGWVFVPRAMREKNAPDQSTLIKIQSRCYQLDTAVW